MRMRVEGEAHKRRCGPPKTDPNELHVAMRNAEQNDGNEIAETELFQDTLSKPRHLGYSLKREDGAQNVIRCSRTGKEETAVQMANLGLESHTSEMPTKVQTHWLNSASWLKMSRETSSR